IGHGCAVREERSTPGGDDGPPDLVGTEIMPTEEVLKVRHSGPTDARALKLSFLGDVSLPSPELARELTAFTHGYRDWYERCVQEADARIPGWGREAAERILGRIRTAVERMEEGARLVCADPAALAAFRVANRTMALQMRHGAKDLAGTPRTRHDPLPQDTSPDGSYAWRPFQLGFFLLCVGGLIDPTRSDRESVDVIWFPTGGGKTEAYLLLACFEMVLRRLRHGTAGGGTAVLSRYTLSLLTTQQFQRAGTTVCALEHLRRRSRQEPSPGLDLGAEPFSLGLWVGEATTPNTYDRAHELAEQQREAARPTDAFILDRCPWCGTRIMPENKSSDPSDYGVRTSPSSFSFFCPRDECAFHEELPVRVVDTHLYDHPPSFLLGTVDKFARLAWEPRAGRLFGGHGRLRPSLVIQDELHLLTGPLGTTVGLYESAVLQLCSWDGVPPKVVASTATIRRSDEQIRRMYGRDVQLFPPPGLDSRHSYFAEPDEDSPGRLYLGVMAQGHTAARATVTTASALLHEAARLPEEHLDDYWTLVAYHHSLRELGRTLTSARDDIPAQLIGMGGDGLGTRELSEASVQELTSNLDREEQPRLLARLYEDRSSPSAVSFLACTNMLSVGVDIDRLALMLMLGQPKAAAEYIQATSRVGRDRVPGLIVSFFNATKPRDRSHYETFGVFHRSLYRHVEPSSVTPWSIPSRKRALHAALVILLRHGHGWAGEDRASLILDHPDIVSETAERLMSWVERAAPDSVSDTGVELKELIDDWRDSASAARSAGATLHWSGQGRSTRHVLKNFDRRNGLWETLHSVRSVDRECQITVKGARS
ncbi:MAG TPA: helicase, partial [Candidatus Nocardiopsis merdipullorum]|nr:helicase [Candidatus Nocardiopsis merdipullorum]